MDLQDSATNDEFNDIEFDQPQPQFTQPQWINELDSIDIFNPPCSLDIKFLLDEVAKIEYRPLKEGRLFAALHCMSLLAVATDMIGIRGAKPSIITLLVGCTAAGKEAGHKYIDAFARILNEFNGHKVKLFGDVRSEKDLKKNLFLHAGKGVYLIDEAHTIIVAAMNKDSHLAAVPDEFMKLATASKYNLSGNHQRELRNEINTAILRTTKQIDSIQDRLLSTPPDHAGKKDADSMRLKHLESDLKDLHDSLESVNNGIVNPVANCYMTSTPTNFDGAISNKSIDSGFMGRLLMLRPDGIEDAIWIDDLNHKNEINEQAIKDFIKPVFDPNFHRGNLEIDEGAYDTLKSFHFYCEDKDRKEDERVGGLWRRAVERVNALLGIICVRDRLVTYDAVLYAIKITVSHITNCEHLAIVNAGEDKQSLASDALDSIDARILKALQSAGKDGVAISKLKQKIVTKSGKRTKDIYNEHVKANQCMFAASASRLVAKGHRIERKGQTFTIIT